MPSSNRYHAKKPSSHFSRGIEGFLYFKDILLRVPRYDLKQRILKQLCAFFPSETL